MDKWTHHRAQTPLDRLKRQLMVSSFRSKMSWELAGIPGMDLLPYARLAGTLIRRSPPIDIPATPISQPLITSPEPSLKLNGFPFLLAKAVSVYRLSIRE